MSVLIEEFCRQPFEIKERLSVLIIDTVGIFWTMKYPNKEDPELFKKMGSFSRRIRY
jgi:Txe/YoeB family toxin of Txe-Axe toxin-antitoxin module